MSRQRWLWLLGVAELYIYARIGRGAFYNDVNYVLFCGVVRGYIYTSDRGVVRVREYIAGFLLCCGEEDFLVEERERVCIRGLAEFPMGNLLGRALGEEWD